MKSPVNRCPRCDQPLTRVGKFWVCPEHGQVSKEDPPFVPMRIFLSYGHDGNEELVLRIKEGMEQRGHDVWIDKSEIKAGQDWRRSITEGIVESDRVLSFLSNHSTRDPGVCLDEIAIALGVKGGNIQTILVESEQDVRPPASISHIQWLDMHDWKDQFAKGEASWEKWYQEKLVEILAVIESDESRRFAGEIERLAECLKPISSDSRIHQLLRKGLVGRTWLFEAMERWRSAADRGGPLFWIMGAPGVGKSAFVAHLSHYGRDKVIAVQFCQYDKPDHRSAHRIVRTLAFQLAARLPDYRTLLFRMPEIKAEELDRKHPAELFDSLLGDPLRHIIDGGRVRYLIVIDALDEAAGDGRNELVDLLAQSAPRLPDWIGIVVTSRPESHVMAPLQGLNPQILDTTTESNRADIRDYLRHELASHLENRPQADWLVEQILENSEGVFLYVERFCEDVRRGHLSLDRPQQFPQGLGGIFFQYFQRQFPHEEEYEDHTQRPLAAILAARERLPVDVLQALFGWRETELRKQLRSLGSLFPVTSHDGANVIKPYHKSLADWLADEAKAGPYFVSVSEGRRLLADYCVRSVHQTEQPPGAYVKRHTAAHLLAEQRWDELAEAIFSSGLDLLNRWTGRGEQVEGEACLRGVIDHLAGRFLFDRAAELSTQLARLLIQLGDHGEAEEFLRQALRWASGPGKIATHSIAWHELGSLMFYQGRHREARRCYRRGLRLAKRASPINHVEAGANLVALATIARSVQRHSKAIRLARQGIEHAEACGDVRHMIAARRLLANSLATKARIADAKHELRRARMLCLEHDFPYDETAILISEAWLAYEEAIIMRRNAADASEPLFHQTLDHTRRVTHRGLQVEALLGLTWCSFIRLDISAARERLNNAAIAAGTEKYHQLAGALRVGRASLTLLTGDLRGAEELYTAARNFCADVNLAPWQADACVGLAAVHHRQDRTQMAHSAEHEALKLARRCGALKLRLVRLGLEHVKANPSAVPY